MPPEPTMRLTRSLLLCLTCILCCLALPVRAADLPYDTGADANLAVSQGLRAAQASGHPLLLLFGANWCEDCRKLDGALHGGENAELMGAEFVVVKIDVGNFDHNMDLAMRFGNPIAGGIPAAVLVAPDETVLYSTHAGELANARRMSATGIHDFFRAMAERGHLPPTAAAAH